MSKDDTAPEAPETCNSSATPSRRGLLVAGAGVAGGGAAQLLAGDVLAAGATATLDRLKRAERTVAVGLIFEVACAKERGPLVNQRNPRLKIYHCSVRRQQDRSFRST